MTPALRNELHYAFYVGPTLYDDAVVQHRAAIETIAAGMDCPSILTARQTARAAHEAMLATAREEFVTGAFFDAMTVVYDSALQAEYEHAMRVYNGLFTSLKNAFDTSQDGIIAAWDNGI